MFINQVSVFIENKLGRFSEVTELLESKNIKILALCIAEAEDFGILRMIVSDPVRCNLVLNDAKITNKLTKILAVNLDEPKKLQNILLRLRNNAISIMYAYSFGSYAVLQVEDPDAVEKILTSKNKWFFNQMVEEVEKAICG